MPNLCSTVVAYLNMIINYLCDFLLFEFLDPLIWDLIGCPEVSEMNYHSTSCNIPVKRRSIEIICSYGFIQDTKLVMPKGDRPLFGPGIDELTGGSSQIYAVHQIPLGG